MPATAEVFSRSVFWFGLVRLQLKVEKVLADLLLIVMVAIRLCPCVLCLTGRNRVWAYCHSLLIKGLGAQGTYFSRLPAFENSLALWPCLEVSSGSFAWCYQRLSEQVSAFSDP